MALGKRAAERGRQLALDASVISREIRRNGGSKRYSGVDALRRACCRPARSIRNKIADTPALLAEVGALFATGATPKQIEVALRRRHGLDDSRRVSQETIYDFTYIHCKGQVKKELIAYLRRKKPPAYPSATRQGEPLRAVAWRGQYRRAPRRGGASGGAASSG